MKGAGLGISSHTKWSPMMAVDIFLLSAKRSLELEGAVLFRRSIVIIYGFVWDGGGVQARKSACPWLRFVKDVVKSAAAWWMTERREKRPAGGYLMAGEG
jgi:hypothetical protein